LEFTTVGVLVIAIQPVGVAFENGASTGLAAGLFHEISSARTLVAALAAVLGSRLDVCLTTVCCGTVAVSEAFGAFIDGALFSLQVAFGGGMRQFASLAVAGNGRGKRSRSTNGEKHQNSDTRILHDFFLVVGKVA